MILARRSWQGGGFNSPSSIPTEKSTETVPESKPSDDSIHTEDIHFEYFKGAYAGLIKNYGKKLGIEEWMKREKYGLRGCVIHITHSEGQIFQTSGKLIKNAAEYHISHEGRLHKLGRKENIYRVVKSYMDSGDKDAHGLIKVITNNYQENA